MSITKHKIFKLKLNDDAKFTITKTVEKAINEFLLDSNIVYVNHSITILTEDIEEYDNLKTICRFLLISIVYKDLNSSSLNVRSTSKKVKNVVHKQIELGVEITEPQIETEIDKEIQQLTKAKKS
ncbi:hypothetical protein GWK08_16825 [Leptobacterium flavescens]|uniref:Uncharacterized protein n=1 Tax=Leptobacterium flavescens TaxID=472055 RepID=A0A6P0UP25_9FLAO|nr:hypothetical protein [Leptobacterium flavescens]NER15121.1 hypothetical protein [Leptobacterium flavescens]